MKYRMFSGFHCVKRNLVCIFSYLNDYEDLLDLHRILIHYLARIRKKGHGFPGGFLAPLCTITPFFYSPFFKYMLFPKEKRIPNINEIISVHSLDKRTLQWIHIFHIVCFKNWKYSDHYSRCLYIYETRCGNDSHIIVYFSSNIYVINVVLLFSLLTCQLWTYFTPFSSVSIVDSEQVNLSWIVDCLSPLCKWEYPHILWTS